MRIGIHSGPVTAGVLRGDRARFQLFGDTINTGKFIVCLGLRVRIISALKATDAILTRVQTVHCFLAARIESTGMRERIHLSEQTAMQLMKFGKQEWMVRREDAVEAKGKGILVTYWLKLNSESINVGSIAASSEWDECEASSARELKTAELATPVIAKLINLSDKTRYRRNQKLVDWNCELLLQLLKQVVARREALQSNSRNTSQAELTAIARNIGDGSMVVEEVADIIEMPEFVSSKNNSEIQLNEEAARQLRDYVATLASKYNDNPCKF